MCDFEYRVRAGGYFSEGELYQTLQYLNFYNDKASKHFCLHKEEVFFVLAKTENFILVLTKKNIAWVDSFFVYIGAKTSDYYKTIEKES